MILACHWPFSTPNGDPTSFPTTASPTRLTFLFVSLSNCLGVNLLPGQERGRSRYLFGVRVSAPDCGAASASVSLPLRRLGHLRLSRHKPSDWEARQHS